MELICRRDLLIAGEQFTNDTSRIALSRLWLIVFFLTATYSSAFLVPAVHNF